MSWWSRVPAPERRPDPFTVVMSLGRPEIALFEVSADRVQSHDPEQHAAPRHWIWQESVSALLHAAFGRGGSVAMRFDEELLPLAWAIARVYVDSTPAEGTRSRADVPLYVITSREASSGTEGDEGREQLDSVRLFEATGIVRALNSAGNTSYLRELGSGRRYGLLLWPDELTTVDVELMDQAEKVSVVRWADRQIPQPWLTLHHEDLTIHVDEVPPLQYLFEDLVDRWIGRPLLGGN